jgi:four helix bundle protein
LAEGFYRYQPADFARFCAMCRGSLGEVKSQLRLAQEQRYLVQEDFDEAWQLACRAMAATTRLQGYLRNCPKRL